MNCSRILQGDFEGAGGDGRNQPMLISWAQEHHEDHSEDASLENLLRFVNDAPSKLVLSKQSDCICFSNDLIKNHAAMC